MMSKLGIDRDADHFGVALLELIQAIGERKNLRGTNKSEIEGIEEQYDFFAFIVSQRDLFKLPIGICIRREIGCFLRNKCSQAPSFVYKQSVAFTGPRSRARGRRLTSGSTIAEKRMPELQKEEKEKNF